jgi:glycosyltransferase involved in cell wall biosynthesis
MKYIVITPAYNEEKFILFTLNSMFRQIHKPEQWVIVDDGSSDRTAEIVRKYITIYPWIKLVTNPVKEPRSFGPKVVRAFNIGMNNLDVRDYGFVVKLDADLTFPPHYFESIATTFQKEKDVGICGGVRIYPHEKKHLSKIAKNLDHVSGGMKAYRKRCYTDMGGLLPVIGWDLIDEHIARYHGWKLKVCTGLVVIHHRIWIDSRRKIINKFEAGMWYYRTRFGFFLVVLNAMRQCFKKPPVLSGILVFTGYWYAMAARKEKFIGREIGESVRKYTYRRIANRLRRLF